jgi:ABC-type Fe3+-siderophore transport system permease subunit
MDGLALPLFLLVSLGGGCGLIVCSVTSQAAFEPAFLLATFAIGGVVIVYSVYSLAAFEHGGWPQ